MLERGVAYVPQGRVIFDELTVAENLAVAARGKTTSPGTYAEKLDELFETFPELKKSTAAPRARSAAA